jgi:hypothetical protein
VPASDHCDGVRPPASRHYADKAKARKLQFPNRFNMICPVHPFREK